MRVNIKSDCRGWWVNDVVEQIFKDRGIEDPEHFLNPKKEDMLPLTDLKNIKEAAQIVLTYVDAGKRISVLFDTDTDGATSGAIIYRYLKHLGADVTPFIGHGKSHGLQKDAVEKFKAFDLLIIVDSLDSNAFLYEEVQKDSNITDIVILDHHTINPKVPYDKFVTLVSSQREYGNPELSGAGVCWKFCKYLDTLLGDDYADELVDLSAVGILSDMMNVTVPENRYIISEGLKEAKNPAINKIVSGFDFDSKSVTFSVAPILNSANRLDQNEYAMKAFIVDDNESVMENVRMLRKCKETQNKEINALMDDVLEQCERQLDKKMIVAFIDTESGIAGLLANKLLEKFKRPIVILKDDGEYYRGSMRAVGVDDFQAMINESGLARAFGHPLAAGCEMKKEFLPLFVQYMEKHLPEVGAFEESIDADIWVDASDVDRGFINQIQKLNKISGTGFPAIRVYLNGIRDFVVTSMSDRKHLVIKLADSELTLIQWNFTGDWDKFLDAALLGDELECVVGLQSGFLGRKFYLQGIVDWIDVKE